MTARTQALKPGPADAKAKAMGATSQLRDDELDSARGGVVITKPLDIPSPKLRDLS